METNFNDLPMLKTPGIGVAMGSAPQEVAGGSRGRTNNENRAGQAVETLSWFRNINKVTS